MGTKLREGKLEVKVRIVPPENFATHDGVVTGKVEDWSKAEWRYPNDSREQIVKAFLAAEPPAVEVQKDRRRRKYSVHSDGEVVAIGMKDEAAAGCVVEFTELTARGKAWWTLGFDVFASPNAITETLERGVSWVVEHYEGPTLRADRSYGYPQWLSLASGN